MKINNVKKCVKKYVKKICKNLIFSICEHYEVDIKLRGCRKLHQATAKPRKQ